jgi:hypothetical protein
MKYEQQNGGALALFDRPIAFHRIFVTWTGSIKAALMLSQLVYWSKHTKDPQGWIYKTRNEWWEELGMNRREQEGAREILKKEGFIQEKRAGHPAKVHFRVNPKIIRELAQAQLVQNIPSSRVQNIPTGGTKHPNSSEITSEITKYKRSAEPERRRQGFDSLLSNAPSGPINYSPAVKKFSAFTVKRGFHMRPPGPKGEVRYKLGGQNGGWSRSKLDHWELTFSWSIPFSNGISEHMTVMNM